MNSHSRNIRREKGPQRDHENHDDDLWGTIQRYVNIDLLGVLLLLSTPPLIKKRGKEKKEYVLDFYWHYSEETFTRHLVFSQRESKLCELLCKILSTERKGRSETERDTRNPYYDSYNRSRIRKAPRIRFGSLRGPLQKRFYLHWQGPKITDGQGRIPV